MAACEGFNRWGRINDRGESRLAIGEAQAAQIDISAHDRRNQSI